MKFLGRKFIQSWKTPPSGRGQSPLALPEKCFRNRDFFTNLKLLIILPVATYIISYMYLAYYHGKISIFNTIVHEG